jgi:hypothetical protein
MCGANRHCITPLAGGDPMTDIVDSYLALRRAVGFELKTAEYLLRSFARYASDRGESLVRTPPQIRWRAAHFAQNRPEIEGSVRVGDWPKSRQLMQLLSVGNRCNSHRSCAREFHDLRKPVAQLAQDTANCPSSAICTSACRNTMAALRGLLPIATEFWTRSSSDQRHPPGCEGTIGDCVNLSPHEVV